MPSEPNSGAIDSMIMDTAVGTLRMSTADKVQRAVENEGDDGLRIVYSDVADEENETHLKSMEEHLRGFTLTDDFENEQQNIEEDLHHVLHQMSFSQSTKL